MSQLWAQMGQLGAQIGQLWAQMGELGAQRDKLLAQMAKAAILKLKWVNSGI